MSRYFNSWLTAMGYSYRHKAEGGERLGLTRRAALARSQGETQVSPTEALAMTAVWLDLPEWDEAFGSLSGNDARRVKRAAKIIRETLGELRKNEAA